MRLLLASALVLGATSVLAQDLPDEDGAVFEVEIDTLDHNITIRRGDDGEAFSLNLPNMDEMVRVWNFEDTPLAWFRGENIPFLSGEPGVSTETSERMRDLEREARATARRARQLEGAEREEAERRLDALLSELFEVRGEARRERAAHLRERARELEAEAAEIEESLRDREARREALIDARRAELLGETDSDW